ncbi:unnamed protein product [Bursaphelenchus okinawaensis]|uniref:Beta-hexosaminidase n=1 Tax=Bursaphelenchus okinawaensis TaxID=465554 RepID=A0A811LM29_9BILA|nr:unnamed protein product [Bursaphelenchus okinawaensis]CAG9124962.1 unnamed protein product [Bursaphelenchus okinawaensis]
MWPIHIFFFTTPILLISAWNPHIPLTGRVLPLPRKITYQPANRTVSPGHVTIDFGHLANNDILKFAKETYENSWFFPREHKRVEQKQSSNDDLVLKVTVKNVLPDDKVYPHDQMNENYTLTVYEDKPAILEADEVWGALRGIETFSQLIFFHEDQYFIRTAYIKDWPEYAYRGLLIDSGRHFLPKNVIKRQIDLLSQNKLNVLHWHVSDSESFPYDSKQFPEMTKQGAYAPKYVYSPEDVQDIVEHARLRGIRVLAEFDTPGHMASWRGIPGLMTKCGDAEPNVLDPSKNSTFEFLEKFFTEIHEVFPESFIHLGGDEIGFFSSCWQHSEDVVKFMEEQGWGKDVNKLVNYYFDRFQGIIENIYNTKDGSNIILWEEIFANNNPRPNSIAHVWLNRDLVQQTTKKGHRTIVSQGWYLDHINTGEDWSYMYSNNPRSFKGTPEQKELIIGGEACMWGEFIDATNLESTVWPRAQAVAERLWSNPTRHASDATGSMFEQVCRSVGRGYYVRPPSGPGFCPFTLDFPFPA